MAGNITKVLCCHALSAITMRFGTDHKSLFVEITAKSCVYTLHNNMYISRTRAHKNGWLGEECVTPIEARSQGEILNSTKNSQARIICPRRVQ